ncbi:MAG: hypothetical protein AAF799_17650 [Myxococcota bacterium]
MAVLAVLIGFPSVFVGLTLDDHLLGQAAVSQPAWDLFRLFEPSTRATAMARGTVGWWAAPELQVVFLRPLSSLLHALDFRVWRMPWLMHLTSVLLYGALVWVAGRLYRRLLGVGFAAGLATLLFAVDDTHGQTLGWLANRNLILATLGGFAVLWAHDRWRRDGWHPGGWLAPVLLVVALSGAEAALTVGGYLFAYALFLDRGPWWRRVSTLLPYLGVVIAWRIAYVASGYGAVASGLYRDPAADPLGLLPIAVRNTSILGFAELTLPVASPLRGMPYGWLWATLGLLAFGVWLLPLLRREATARFFAVGMLVCALPYASTDPSGRILLPLGLGGCGLLALAIADSLAPAPRLRGSRWVGRGLLLLHLWISVLLFVPSSWVMYYVDRYAQELSVAVTDHDVAPGEVVVVVNVPYDILLMHPQAIAAEHGQRWPDHVVPLYAGQGLVTVERVADDTLRLEAPRGWMGSPLNRIARAEGIPMRVGERVELPTAVIEVVAVNGAGRPTEIRAVFDRPLDSLHWVAWLDGHAAPWSAPQLGDRHALPTKLELISR